VAGDGVGLLRALAQHGRCCLHQVLVAGAMEAVATDLQTPAAAAAAAASTGRQLMAFTVSGRGLGLSEHQAAARTSNK
jgi:hypothetical protein